MTDIQLLRRPDVERLVRLSRTTIYQLMKTGNFPKPLRISAQAVAWRLSDIQAWVDSRPTAIASGDDFPGQPA